MIEIIEEDPVSRAERIVSLLRARKALNPGTARTILDQTFTLEVFGDIPQFELGQTSKIVGKVLDTIEEARQPEIVIIKKRKRIRG